MMRPGYIYPEIYDYFDFETVEDTVSKYLFLIQEAKKTLKIPVIASINCVSSDEWTLFAKRIEDAGADALELNVFVLPSNFNRSGIENEKLYFDIIYKVRKSTNLPITLKISHYFSNLGSMIQKLSNTGISGIVLFNRFFNPDIDTDSMQIVPINIYSTPADLAISLRWIAIMSGRVGCDLIASTGVHYGNSLIKQLLAGANSVQIASTLYKHGTIYIETMLEELTEWMESKNFETIDQFRGKMSQVNIKDPAAYERVQFMRHFSGKNF
jgi:dihydroorotate dehydrogenase (fumarate)